MLMADHGYSVHSQTYIATDDSLANRRADLVALMSGECADGRPTARIRTPPRN